MEKSTNLWEAWNLAKAYHRAPSEIYHISDEIAAWSFDRAVYMFGSRLDAELKNAVQGAKSDAQANGRRQRVLNQWLGDGRPMFKDPVATGSGEVTSRGTGPVTL